MNALHPDSAVIVVAIGDEALRAEAVHAAAATSHDVLTVTDPRDIPRSLPGAYAVLVDSLMARVVAAARRTHTAPAPVLFLAADPGPIDYEAALACHAESAFIIPAQVKELLASIAAAGAPQEARPGSATIAVVGASGGVGTSTFAAALARTQCAADGRALLVDAHPCSGGLDLLLGVEAEPGARWPELTVGDGSIDAADLYRALPSTPDGVAVLSAARSTVADPFRLDKDLLARVVGAAHAGEGICVVDCTPETIPDACTHVIIVVATEVRSAASAAQLLVRLDAARRRCVVVLRQRQWASLSAAEIERIVHSTVLAELPTLRGLTRAVEIGGLPQRLPAPLRKAARAVLEEVGA
ncbi:septum formation initiator [Corynebacterium tuberculostearicum]|uniref:septum site-determining protein Ssd n=1 Tax=Corynebacterium tuberculostearicum TaxID=38304 RepID=UPI0026669352|nr:septum site-determining protein Ssd [Corynebacterium tuberculostearicum]WKE51167.1 septum formation initiator [Corynebacterium tuberculostearicum]